MLIWVAQVVYTHRSLRAGSVVRIRGKLCGSLPWGMECHSHNADDDKNDDDDNDYDDYNML